MTKLLAALITSFFAVSSFAAAHAGAPDGWLPPPRPNAKEDEKAAAKTEKKAAKAEKKDAKAEAKTDAKK